MVRPPSFDRNGKKSGAWNEEEDNKLRNHVLRFGHPNWRMVPLVAGLARCGKSCRLRWMNYLKPGLKRGNFTKQEENLIITLHARFGTRWSAMAAQLPGRTDNDIKNFWHAHIKKRPQNINGDVITEDDDQQQSSDSLITNVVQNPHENNINGVVITEDDDQQQSSDSVITNVVQNPQENIVGDYNYYFPPLPPANSCCSADHEIFQGNNYLASEYSYYYPPLEEEDGIFYVALW